MPTRRWPTPAISAWPPRPPRTSALGRSRSADLVAEGHDAQGVRGLADKGLETREGLEQVPLVAPLADDDVGGGVAVEQGDEGDVAARHAEGRAQPADLRIRDLGLV